jgi:hypothetical protein
MFEQVYEISNIKAIMCTDHNDNNTVDVIVENPLMNDRFHRINVEY